VHPFPVEERLQACSLWLRSGTFHWHTQRVRELIRDILDANPFTTLQVVLEPTGSLEPAYVHSHLDDTWLQTLLLACQETPTYLDKYYALQPGPLNGAKRLVLLLPLALRERLAGEWIARVGECATLVWRGDETAVAEEELDGHEYLEAGQSYRSK
jgi:hypothetical protein